MGSESQSNGAFVKKKSNGVWRLAQELQRNNVLAHSGSGPAQKPLPGPNTSWHCTPRSKNNRLTDDGDRSPRLAAHATSLRLVGYGWNRRRTSVSRASRLTNSQAPTQHRQFCGDAAGGWRGGDRPSIQRPMGKKRSRAGWLQGAVARGGCTVPALVVVVDARQCLPAKKCCLCMKSTLPKIWAEWPHRPCRVFWLVAKNSLNSEETFSALKCLTDQIKPTEHVEGIIRAQAVSLFFVL